MDRTVKDFVDGSRIEKFLQSKPTTNVQKFTLPIPGNSSL